MERDDISGNRLVIDSIDLVVRRANVHVENGLGATNGNPGDPSNSSAAVVNGKGNLIIGYNEMRSDGAPVSRPGSHNLIIGAGHSYASYGCLVAGSSNTATAAAPYSALAGSGNTASGNACSVLGGAGNTASGDSASVTGGMGNTASGPQSVVSGGQSNVSGGKWSSVSGGGATML